MSSDVCKHCTHAACLDVCPTGALFRTEFGTVVVQGDICNGCGYCVPACPYGVIDQRKDDGRVFKCTMCYDRLTDGLMPACATACPTQSIQFGDLDELQERADARLATLQGAGRGVGPALRAGRERRRRWRRGVLPAARRAGGLRPAAGPDRGHPGPARDLAGGRGGRRDGDRRRVLCVHRTEAVDDRGSDDARGRLAARRRLGRHARRRQTPQGRRRPPRRDRDGAGGGVQLLLRPADRQAGDVEEPRGAAVPVPRRHGRHVGGDRGAGRVHQAAAAGEGRRSSPRPAERWPRWGC